MESTYKKSERLLTSQKQSGKSLSRLSRPLSVIDESGFPAMIFARLGVLRGEFMSDDFEYSWDSPRKTLVIFVSSTFTDTHDERNILLEKVQPYLRDNGRAYGIEVTFVDMRYGVVDENTLDHMTWEACERELRRCFEESGGVFFLSLLGDKYGYKPLPRTIDQEAFETRMNEYSRKETNATKRKEMKSLASEWYKLDLNAIPPFYQLKSLKNLEDDNFWNVVHPRLSELFDGVVFDPEFPDGLVGRSVTDYEVRTAMSLCQDTLGVKNGMRWIQRQFTEPVPREKDPHKLLCDTSDANAKQKLSSLKDILSEKLKTQKLMHTFTISPESYLAKDKEWKVRIY